MTSPTSTKDGRYDDRNCRDYNAELLPVLLPSISGGRQELLYNLYSEVCSSWRALLEVRFKLMLILPTISVAALGELVLKQSSAPPISRSLIAAIGLIVTSLLVLYDHRNCELYMDLIRRGRQIEKELGVDTGLFLGRLKAPILIERDLAIKLTYSVVLVGW